LRAFETDARLSIFAAQSSAMPFGCWFFEARFTQALANRATALFCTGGHAKLAAGRFRLFAGVPVAIRQESAIIVPNQALRQLQLGLHRAAHKISVLWSPPPTTEAP